MEGVAQVAEETVDTARALHAVVEQGRKRLLGNDDVTVLSLRLFELLPKNPILSVNRAMELLSCSRPAAAKALDALESAEIMFPRDHHRRNRVLIFDEYLSYLRQDTELDG